MKYLIFDFDGVLGDTFDPRLEILLERGDRTKEEILQDTNRYFSKSTHTRELNLSEQSLDAMRGWVTTYGRLQHQKGFNLFDDFIKELRKLQDVKMAVVSSGSAVYIKPKLKNCGLKFSHILTFEDHHSKEEKVEQICKEWGILVKDAYFFTDTISDVKELGNIMNKDKIYGCAWGYQGYKKISSVLDKNHILNKFSDIQKVKWK